MTRFFLIKKKNQNVFSPGDVYVPYGLPKVLRNKGCIVMFPVSTKIEWEEKETQVANRTAAKRKKTQTLKANIQRHF